MGPISATYLVACGVTAGLSLFPRWRAGRSHAAPLLAAMMITTNQVYGTLVMSLYDAPAAFLFLPPMDLVCGLSALIMWRKDTATWKRIVLCLFAAILLNHVWFGLWQVGALGNLSETAAYWFYQFAKNALFALVILTVAWPGADCALSLALDWLLPDPLAGSAWPRDRRRAKRYTFRGGRRSPSSLRS